MALWESHSNGGNPFGVGVRCFRKLLLTKWNLNGKASLGHHGKGGDQGVGNIFPSHLSNTVQMVILTNMHTHYTTFIQSLRTTDNNDKQG